MNEETIRSFVAVDFPEAVHQTCSQIQRELDEGLRGISWVKHGNIHLTFKFLGDITHAQKNTIADALRSSLRSFGPFGVTLGGVGVFPNWRRPRVLWLGITEGKDRLIALSEVIEKSLQTVGIARDKKPFRPHLTLARIRRPMDLSPIQSRASHYETLALEPMIVTDVALVQSVLHRSGSIYTTLERFPISVD